MVQAGGRWKKRGLKKWRRSLRKMMRREVARMKLLRKNELIIMKENVMLRLLIGLGFTLCRTRLIF